MNQGPQYFDRRITIQQKTMAPNGRGGFTETWTDWKTVWAKKTVHRSNEAVETMKTTGKSTVNWRIRYKVGASGSMRVKSGNDYMSIVGPPMEIWWQGQRCLDLTCEEAK